MHLSLPDFRRACVLVVGDVMLDLYWHGETRRISPEAPVPVVRIDKEGARAGGAGNVAVNVAALGGQARLIGLVGDDPEADRLQALLTAQGVECALVRCLPHTLRKLRVVSRQQQLIRLDFEPPAGAADLLLNDYRRWLTEADCVVLSDYAKGALAGVCTLIDLARAAGRPVYIDPKGTDFARYRGASLLTPNLAEFEAVAGLCANAAEIARKGEALRAQLGLEALLVTRGEEGMTLIEAGCPVRHFPTRAREVYDVTGAGDTVIAALAASIAAGACLEEAVQIANYAAGVVVGKLGTATASPEEILAALDSHAPLPRGVVDEEGLLRLVARARAAGERIVMTNGCFDLLHPGHVGYLAQARALGDRLIVAMNDDASVRRLKGERRPINPLAARMTVLAALASVDWVVAFSEDTPERLICRVRPDVLVKGGDYRPEEIAGAHCVRAAGGEVRVLPYVQGYSTTRIIDRLNAR